MNNEQHPQELLSDAQSAEKSKEAEVETELATNLLRQEQNLTIEQQLQKRMAEIRAQKLREGELPADVSTYINPCPACAGNTDVNKVTACNWSV